MLCWLFESFCCAGIRVHLPESKSHHIHRCTATANYEASQRRPEQSGRWQSESIQASQSYGYHGNYYSSTWPYRQSNRTFLLQCHPQQVYNPELANLASYNVKQCKMQHDDCRATGKVFEVTMFICPLVITHFPLFDCSWLSFCRPESVLVRHHRNGECRSANRVGNRQLVQWKYQSRSANAGQIDYHQWKERYHRPFHSDGARLWRIGWLLGQHVQGW